MLDRGLAVQPDSPLLRANRRAVVMRWAEPAFHRGDYAEAIRRTTCGATPGRLHDALAGNVRYGYYHWISGLLTEGRRQEAEQVRRRALADPFLQGQADSAIPPFDVDGTATGQKTEETVIRVQSSEFRVQDERAGRQLRVLNPEP